MSVLQTFTILKLLREIASHVTMVSDDSISLIQSMFVDIESKLDKIKTITDSEAEALIRRVLTKNLSEFAIKAKLKDVAKFYKTGLDSQDIKSTDPKKVAFESVILYLCTEIIELASNVAFAAGRNILQPEDIYNAIESDEELQAIFGHAVKAGFKKKLVKEYITVRDLIKRRKEINKAPVVKCSIYKDGLTVERSNFREFYDVLGIRVNNKIFNKDDIVEITYDQLKRDGSPPPPPPPPPPRSPPPRSPPPRFPTPLPPSPSSSIHLAPAISRAGKDLEKGRLRTTNFMLKNICDQAFYMHIENKTSTIRAQNMQTSTRIIFSKEIAKKATASGAAELENEYDISELNDLLVYFKTDKVSIGALKYLLGIKKFLDSLTIKELNSIV